MLIDEKKCVACGNCIPICPMGAIHIDPVRKRATVNQDECVECYTCFRGMSKEHLNPTVVRTIRKIGSWLRWRFDPEPDVCPTAAFVLDELSWPRIVRRVFSDPLVEHASTGIHGRGTEEVKTNDVSGRVGIGEVGYVIEFGRPGVGVRFREIQAMTMALAAAGVTFEPKNPITHLMTDPATGTLKDDLLDEKILSAIVETKTSIADVRKVLDVVSEVAKGLDTVVAVGVSTRCDDQGEDPLLMPLLRDAGFTVARAKTNMGLGRVTNRQPPEGVRDEHAAPLR